MTANSGAAITYTATRNATTEKITITGSSNFSLLFNNSLNNTSNKLLGFNNTDYTGSNTYTADNVFDMRGIEYISVKFSNELPSKLYDDQFNIGNSFIIPVNTTFGNVIEYERNNDFEQFNHHFTYNTNINHITCGLFDQDQNPLDLNGVNCYCVLQFNK
eukprot:TRINITY_DN1171_c1_g1_i4.p1 TRINITY_DN1171_c1_g1~~TRINITY_DN1171_c1_g1_i4.p1  ORF type:complete len:160 (-),score=22.20 TRINITY_DN1171_c1_g1_i4:275-754(-)